MKKKIQLKISLQDVFLTAANKKFTNLYIDGKIFQIHITSSFDCYSKSTTNNEKWLMSPQVIRLYRDEYQIEPSGNKRQSRLLVGIVCKYEYLEL